MSDIVKIAAAAIVAAVCAVVVRKQAPEIGMLLAACASVLILLYCSGAFRSFAVLMDKLAEMGGLSQELLKPVMKVIGIAVITSFASELCRDAKEGALASTVETAGSLVAFLTILPLMTAALELLGELL